MLTITFAEDLSTKEAQRRFHSFATGVLAKHFGDYIAVREFTQRGRPHFHVLIDCLGDVTTGYNWTHHDKVNLWRKGGCKGAKPRGKLNRTDRLAELHPILLQKALKYKLGKIIELAPVRKPEAVAFYLGGYLSKSLANKPQDAKGTRAVNYSRQCPRTVKGAFSWANVAGWLWRAKLRHFCLKRGWTEELYAVLPVGFRRWIYTQRDADVSIFRTAHRRLRCDGRRRSRTVNGTECRLYFNGCRALFTTAALLASAAVANVALGVG